MKTMLRTLAFVLAFGAITQTIYTYAEDREPVSVEVEENALMRLLEMKQKMDNQGLTLEDVQPEDGTTKIKTEEEFKEAFARHSLRYIEAIGGVDALIRMLNRPEFASMRDRVEPGI